MYQFDMALPSTLDDVTVEYEPCAGDAEVGQPAGFEFDISNEQGLFTGELTQEDYEAIYKKIEAHYNLLRQAEIDEAAIARWEANND